MYNMLRYFSAPCQLQWAVQALLVGLLWELLPGDKHKASNYREHTSTRMWESSSVQTRQSRYLLSYIDATGCTLPLLSSVHISENEDEMPFGNYAYCFQIRGIHLMHVFIWLKKWNNLICNGIWNNNGIAELILLSDNERACKPVTSEVYGQSNAMTGEMLLQVISFAESYKHMP